MLREPSEAERNYLEFVKARYSDTEAYERWLAAKHPEYKFNGIATEINYGD